MKNARVLVLVWAWLGIATSAAAQDVPDNAQIEQDLDRITAAPDYHWLKRQQEPEANPHSSGPVSIDESEKNARSRLSEDPDADCGYGPAPQDKPDKGQPADRGQGGGCGEANPGSGSDEGGGCQRRVGPSCEGCGPSTGCQWGGGLPACGCAGVGTMTGYMLGGLFLAVLLVLLLLAVARRSGRTPLSVQSLDLDEARPQDVRISQLPEAPLDTMLRRAEAAAAAGDYRTAVGWCYLAGLSVLHRLGRIDLRRSTTNFEIVETVRRRGGNYEATKSLVRIFEDIFFGARTAVQAHYLSCREIVENQLG